MALDSSSSSVRVAVRHLPPLLPAKVFWEGLSADWALPHSPLAYIGGKCNPRTELESVAHVRVPRSELARFAAHAKTLDFGTKYAGRARAEAVCTAHVAFRQAPFEPLPEPGFEDELEGTIESEPDYQAFLASLKELEESLKDPVPAPLVVPDSPDRTPLAPPTTSLVAHILKCRAKGKSSAKAAGEPPKAKGAKKVLVAKKGDPLGGGGPSGRAKIKTGALPSAEEEAAGQRTTPLKAVSNRKGVPGKKILGVARAPITSSAPLEPKPALQPKILARTPGTGGKGAESALATKGERLPSAPRMLPVALAREPEAEDVASPRPAFEKKGKQRLIDKKPSKASAASATAAKPEAASPAKKPVKPAGKGRTKAQKRPEFESAPHSPALAASLKPAAAPAEAPAAPPVPKILARPKPVSAPGPRCAAESPPASHSWAPKLGKGAKGKGFRAEGAAGTGAVPVPRAPAPKLARKGSPAERQTEPGPGGDERPLFAPVGGLHPPKPRPKKVPAEGEAGERPPKPKFVPRSRN